MKQSINDKLNWFIWAKACECMVYSIGLRWIAEDVMWLGGWDTSNVPFAIALMLLLLWVCSIAVGVNAIVWILNRWFWRDYAEQKFAEFLCLQRDEDEKTV